MKVAFCLIVALLSLYAPARAQTGPHYSTRILFIPLDDRPPCLQFTERMGLIGDAQVITPPKELLGRFTTPGQSDKIIAWLHQQDVQSFDAAIVALDMLAYGGLVGSRTHRVSSADALKHLEILREVREKAPKLPIYAQGVIMRLAPTADGKNEAHRQKLADWAEITVATDAPSKARTAQLEREIPADVLADYKQARERNLKTNQKAIDFVREGIITYLILGQDDAKPQGIHVADRESLIAQVNQLGLTEKIAIQPGADEVSMLLMARALTTHYRYAPKIKAVYSSEKGSQTVMPFEDRPLRQTVSFHIRATGSREVDNERDADVLFYVYTSRFEGSRAGPFAGEIESKLRQGARVIVADIDPRGDVQGGDAAFTKALESRQLLARLNGYASWNTAGNTIGTALPQGVIFAVAQTKLLTNKSLTNRIRTAQHWFTLHRVVDDFYYHNLIRKQANEFARQVRRSSNVMTDEMTQQVEAYCLNRLQPAFRQLVNHYFADSSQTVRCKEPANLRFDLPWNRTFEAEIDFDLTCTTVP